MLSSTINTTVDPILQTGSPELVIDPVDTSGGGSFEGTKIDRFLDRVEDKAVSVVDKVTSVSDAADNFTDYLINKARSLQNRAGSTAEDNLTKAKAGSYGRKAVEWMFENPGILTGVLVVIAIFIFRKQ